MFMYQLRIGSIKCEYTFIFHLTKQVRLDDWLVCRHAFKVHRLQYRLLLQILRQTFSLRLQHLLPLHHLKRSDSKRFTRQIVLRHVNLSQTALIKGCEMLPSHCTLVDIVEKK